MYKFEDEYNFKECTERQLAWLKDAYDARDEEWKKEHIDLRFRSIIDRLNSMHLVATLYHCSGHVDSDGPDADIRKSKVMSYICLVGIGEAIDKLNALIRSPKMPGDIWGYSPGTAYISPWHAVDNDDCVHERPNTCSLYLELDKEDDLTGMKTVKLWEELLSDFIGDGL